LGSGSHNPCIPSVSYFSFPHFFWNISYIYRW